MAKEASVSLHKLPAGSPVFVYCHSSKAWKGPFKSIHVEGETVVLKKDTAAKYLALLV